MKPIHCNIPDSLLDELEKRMAIDQASCDTVIAEALSRYFEEQGQTLFQVSTSAALVQGLYQGAIQVSRLLRHGDFGLGTFVDLDGEMVILDGTCYQVSSSGTVRPVEGDRFIPYAVVTLFRAEACKRIEGLRSLSELIAVCDDLRKSNNVFYAFRAEGKFAFVKARVMRLVQNGVGLSDAASGQAEFLFEEMEGSLVGLWSPTFAGAFSVVGYHFHFISKDRRHGGHVLGCEARNITIEGCRMSEMQVSLPETEEFLGADLSKDPNEDLARAEQDHST